MAKRVVVNDLRALTTSSPTTAHAARWRSCVAPSASVVRTRLGLGTPPTTSRDSTSRCPSRSAKPIWRPFFQQQTARHRRINTQARRWSTWCLASAPSAWRTLHMSSRRATRCSSQSRSPTSISGRVSTPVPPGSSRSRSDRIPRKHDATPARVPRLVTDRVTLSATGVPLPRRPAARCS